MWVKTLKQGRQGRQGDKGENLMTLIPQFKIDRVLEAMGIYSLQILKSQKSHKYVITSLLTKSNGVDFFEQAC